MIGWTRWIFWMDIAARFCGVSLESRWSCYLRHDVPERYPRLAGARVGTLRLTKRAEYLLHPSVALSRGEPE